MCIMKDKRKCRQGRKVVKWFGEAVTFNTITSGHSVAMDMSGILLYSANQTPWRQERSKKRIKEWAVKTAIKTAIDSHSHACRINQTSQSADQGKLLPIKWKLARQSKSLKKPKQCKNRDGRKEGTIYPNEIAQ